MIRRKKLSPKQLNLLLASLNIAAIIIATIALVVNYFEGGIIYKFTQNDLESVLLYFESRPFYSQAGLVLFLVLVEVIIGLIPAVVMYPIVGLLIGIEWGIFLIFLGNIIGNSVNYIQGKIIARAFISNEKNKKLLTKLKDGGTWSLFLLRLNPLTSFDSISYFAGALGMKFGKFTLATLAGITPLVVLGTIAGDEFLMKFKFGLELLVVFTIGYIFYSIIKFRKSRF